MASVPAHPDDLFVEARTHLRALAGILRQLETAMADRMTTIEAQHTVIAELRQELERLRDADR